MIQDLFIQTPKAMFPARAINRQAQNLDDVLEEAQWLADNWHDTKHVYKPVAIKTNRYGDEYPVYDDNYEIQVDRPDEGNFVVVSRHHLNEEPSWEEIARIPCAIGQVKEVYED